MASSLLHVRDAQKRSTPYCARGSWPLGELLTTIVLLVAACACPPAAAASESGSGSNLRSQLRGDDFTLSCQHLGVSVVELQKLSFVDGVVGFAVGTTRRGSAINGTVWRTEDAGSSWAEVSLPGGRSFSHWATLAAATAQSAVLAPRFASDPVRFTRDGHTFLEAKVEGEGLDISRRQIAHVKGTSSPPWYAFATSGNGDLVFLSKDGGASFKPRKGVPPADGSNARFRGDWSAFPAPDAWYFGPSSSPTIWKSTDALAGELDEVLHVSAAPLGAKAMALRQILCASPTDCFVLGAEELDANAFLGPVVLRSSDGGKAWKKYYQMSTEVDDPVMVPLLSGRTMPSNPDAFWIFGMLADAALPGNTLRRSAVFRPLGRWGRRFDRSVLPLSHYFVDAVGISETRGYAIVREFLDPTRGNRYHLCGLEFV